MNKDEIVGLVERLMSKVFGNLTPGAIDHADLDGMAFLVEDAADALTTLSAERDYLQRRLDSICMNIHTCSGADCERPICLERRKNAILSARVETLEAALRRCFKGETQAIIPFTNPLLSSEVRR